MKIAVLSDIHGNYVAMDTCVKYALNKGAEAFVFLGDYLGELAYPERTMQYLYRFADRHPCYFVRGNKEEYWINHQQSGETVWYYGDSTTGSLLYQYERLSEQDMEFYKSLPICRKISFKGLPDLTICHGSPYQVNQHMKPDDDATREIMEKSETEMILCGHTHYQHVIGHHGRYALNPGSVGVSIDSGGMTQFLLLDGKSGVWEYELVSLEYDVERVIAELYEAGLNLYAPCWCRVTEHLLRTGCVSHAQVLFRAMDICREKTGNCIWPAIPEACWKQAVSELIG